MKISDNSLATYGFNRGDIVIVSRLAEHTSFRRNYIYMISELDNGIYPRVAELAPSNLENSVSKILVNPMDRSDQILFSPLPVGMSLIGRIVWKGVLI